jgi:hypothetical protein
MQRSVKPQNLTVTNQIAQILSHSNKESILRTTPHRGTLRSF